MAKARVVVGDQQSEEFDELRRTVHTLLHMLESAKEAIDTNGADAEQVLEAWADAVITGKDDNPTGIVNVVPTNREVLGVHPSRALPARPRMTQTVDLPIGGKNI